MQLILIGNKHHGDTGYYVGRPSLLGNPFQLDKNVSRAQHLHILAQYMRWLWEQIKAGGAVYRELCRLRDRLMDGDKTLTLVCYCAPKPCHAEIIRDALMWMVHEKVKATNRGSGLYQADNKK